MGDTLVESRVRDLAVQFIVDTLRMREITLPPSQVEGLINRLAGAMQEAIEDETEAIARDLTRAFETCVLHNRDGKYLDTYGGATWAVAGARTFSEDAARIAKQALPAEEGWEVIPRPIY